MSRPGLHQELEKLTENHRVARSRLGMLTKISRLLSLALVLVLVGFLTSIYGKVTSMYAPENFEKPLQEEARYLLPKLEPELRMLWEETAPVYGELAVEKFEEALPAVQIATEAEIAALRRSLVANAEDRIDEALARIARKRERQLKQHFPTLATKDGADEMGMRWMEAVEADLEEILLYFHDRYSGDLGELAATLEQFRSDEFEQMDKDDLTRQFIHLWLMKVDRMVMLQDIGEDNEEDNDHDD